MGRTVQKSQGRSKSRTSKRMSFIHQILIQLLLKRTLRKQYQKNKLRQRKLRKLKLPSLLLPKSKRFNPRNSRRKTLKRFKLKNRIRKNLQKKQQKQLSLKLLQEKLKEMQEKLRNEINNYHNQHHSYLNLFFFRMNQPGLKFSKYFKIQNVIAEIKQKQQPSHHNSIIQTPLYSQQKLNQSKQLSDYSLDYQISQDILDPVSFYNNPKKEQKFCRSMSKLKSLIDKSRGVIQKEEKEEKQEKQKPFFTNIDSDLLNKLQIEKKNKSQFRSKQQAIEYRMKSKYQQQTKETQKSVHVSQEVEETQESKHNKIVQKFKKRLGLQIQSKPRLKKTESSVLLIVDERRKVKSTLKNNQSQQQIKSQNELGQKLEKIQIDAKQQHFQQKLLRKSNKFFKGMSLQFSKFYKTLNEIQEQDQLI